MKSTLATTFAVLLFVLPAASVEPRQLEVKQSWPIDYATHHVQGLAATDDTFWITSVDRAAKAGWVYKVDRPTMRVARERQLTIGEQYHPGGVQLAAGKLWVPLAEYRPRSTSTILALNPNSLDTEATFTLDDHIGALAADGRGTLYAGNWDCRQIYVLSEDGTVKRKVDNPTPVAYQDFEYHDGLLWGGGRLREDSRSSAVVDVIDTSTWKLRDRYVLRGELKSSGSDFTREGLSKLGKSLFVLPEDGPRSTVYRFSLE
ncbi:MAG: hypothetical protein HYX69_11480 [Planctomycetia bacterium]|nr:hypothetical protein [Planctomycetia bacterium]